MARGPVGVVGWRGTRFGLYRGPRAIYVGGILRRLVVIGAIGTIYFGTQVYYPYGYAAVPQPYCGGATDDGCTLTWRDVPTEDGSLVPQCVQYCPQGVTPQPQAVSSAQTAPPPTGNEGACEVKGFAEPDLQGQSFTTSDNYPQMDEWKAQVASIQVTAGTWDFYSDENYGGDVIRLTPGSYRTLGDNWTYAISSFMCSQPGGGEPGGGMPGGGMPGGGMPGGPPPSQK